MKYPVSKPDVGELEKRYVNEALDSGWISCQSPIVEKFESAFADYIGAKYAVSCDSGWAALVLAISALNIKEGDEIITSEFTMYATAEAIVTAGATPVFVDCGPDLNIDVSKIEAAITPRTRAILPVHIYGRPANLAAIKKIAFDRNLYVIEDAAEALGATQNGKKVGSIGDIGCFSFYANKNITTGMGGMVTTNDAHFAEQARHIRGFAFDANHTFYHPKRSFNLRMPALSAAIGLAQLERIDEFLAKRKQIQKWYDERLNPKAVRSEGEVCWMYDILLEPKPESKTTTPLVAIRDALIKHLEANGIESRRFFLPMSVQPCLRRYVREDPTKLKALEYAVRGLYLPTYTALTEEDVDTICKAVNAFFYDKTGAGKGSDGNSQERPTDAGTPGAVSSEADVGGVGEAGGGAGAGGDAKHDQDDKKVV